MPPTGSTLPPGYSPPSLPWPLNHATFDMSFDIEMSVLVNLSDWPSAPTYTGTSLLNTSVQPTGATHTLVDIGDALHGLGNALVSFFTEGGFSLKAPSPSAALQAATSALVGLPIPGSLSAIASKVAQVEQAAARFGFLACTASTDATTQTPLTLTLIHPLDPPPVAYDLQTMAGPGQQLFTGFSIATAQSQATAGGQLDVIGSGFQATEQLGIGWTNTCSGTVTGSDVLWGLHRASRWQSPICRASANFRYMPFARAPREPVPLHGQAPESGLYGFRVRNSDDDPVTPLTTTQFSAPLTIWSVGAVDLILTYPSSNPVALHGMNTGTGIQPVPPSQQPATGVVVGTAQLLADGTFAQNITVPPDALPGQATLCAQVLGQRVVCTQFTIVAEIEPLVRMVNPVTLTDLGTVLYSGATIWTEGEGFVPQGTASLSIAGYNANVTLAQAVVTDQGTFLCSFRWPALPSGNQTVQVVEDYQGQVTQASLVLTEQSPLE